MPIHTSIPFRFYAVSCIMYAVKYNIIGGSLLNIAQSISDYSVSDYYNYCDDAASDRNDELF